MKRMYLGLCLFFLAASVYATQVETVFEPLAARYRESRGDGHGRPHVREWFFVREANRVELGRGPYVELWERDERGEVSWQRIFHDERKLIAYTPGELRTQQRAPAWGVLNTLIDERLLTTLTPVGPARHLGRKATRYRGRVGEEWVEVVWLDAERLPAQVARRDAHHVYRLRLMELLPAPRSTWPRANPERAAEYEQIDGADLGDREYDPFVRKILAVDAVHGGHAH